MLVSKIKHSIKSHAMMWLCCFVMALPLAYFVMTNWENAGFWQLLLQASPLILCVGAHFILHKFMGKSCHSSHEKNETKVRRSQ